MMKHMLGILCVIFVTIDVCESVHCLYWTDCDEACGGGRRHCPRSNGKEFNINCHLQDCIKFDGCGKADIVYVIDESTSIGEKNYWVTKQFAIDVMKGLTIAPDETRIAVVTFADIAITHWELGEYNTEEDLERKIWDLEYVTGVTHTKDGLDHAQLIINRTARADVKHIVVVITDGASNVWKELTVPTAQAMHALGTEIFTIGIGNVDPEELEGMASLLTEDHYYYVPDYNSLIGITNTIINETCTSANLTFCYDWNEWTDCPITEEVCTDANQTRTRECHFYDYPGAPPYIRVDTDYLPCGPPCPTTAPPAPEPCEWTECDKPCDIGSRTCQRSSGYVWTMPCNTHACDPVDCTTTDVTFILDSSNSIGDRNWWIAKQFTIDVMKGLQVEEQSSRVAAVTFSNQATTEWELQDMDATDSLEAAIWALPWEKGVTNTQDGLNHATEIFTKGGREGVKHIAILLSDGESNLKPEQTIPVADLLKAQGVQVFAIGVRTAGIEELKAIASDPVDMHYHEVSEYQALRTIVNTVIEETCSAESKLP